MLAYRVTFQVKRGRMQEAFALFKAGIVQPGVPNAVYRLYTSHEGPRDQLVFERVYESAADQEKAHAEYSSRPDAAEFWSKFNALVEGGGTSEIWKVEEWRWD